MKVTEAQAWRFLSIAFAMNAHLERHIDNPQFSALLGVRGDNPKRIRNPNRNSLTRWGICEAIYDLEAGAVITEQTAERMEWRVREQAEVMKVHRVSVEYLWDLNQKGDLSRMRWAAKQAKSLEQERA